MSSADCCALKVADDGERSDVEVQLEAERIVVESFVLQQQTAAATAAASSHSDILVLDADGANSRASSKKSHKKSMKERY